MIFDLFDKGNKEKITKDDLIALSKELSLNLKEKDIEIMIRKANNNEETNYVKFE